MRRERRGWRGEESREEKGKRREETGRAVEGSEGEEREGEVREGRERTTLRTPCHKFLAIPLVPHYSEFSYK